MAGQLSSRVPISEPEFAQFQRFIFEAAGITMSGAKKALVSGRLARRLEFCGVASYGEYFRFLQSGKANAEVQVAIDLLTTNETYFFREPKHFDLLRKKAQAARVRGGTFRVWSAACSSGEESYSIAMVLAEVLGQGQPWEIISSDISSRVLAKARFGHYPLERTRHVPPEYLRKYCLRGTGVQDGTLLVDKALRKRVQFSQINLNTALPSLGKFDVVFLRNVMIYFNGETKREVVDRIAATLKPDGCLLIGHSETLNDVTDSVVALAPSIYRLP